MKLTETILRLRQRGGEGHSGSAVTDPEMQALKHSFDLYRGRAPWLRSGKGLNLAAGIAAELSRLTLSEFQPGFGSSPADRRLQEALTPFLRSLRTHLEYAAAVGGVMLKPCFDGKRLTLDVLLPFDFQVLGTDGCGGVTACAFRYHASYGGKDYLRIEEHRPYGDGYRITNRVYEGEKEVSLGVVPMWASLASAVEIRHLKRPLFQYFKMPQGNPDFPLSPLGVPVFRRAEGLISEADRQFERLLWEFEGGELAVDASEDAFRLGRDGKPQLPTGKERLYRVNALDACCSSNELLSVFAPTLRDKSLINGLNRIIMCVEDACGIARGTFSDPSEVAKTATEVKAMRQRTYGTVTAIQSSLGEALAGLCEVMNLVASLYHLWEGEGRILPTFGDGVLSDADSDKNADREDVKAGILTAEEYKAKWHKGGRR